MATAQDILGYVNEVYPDFSTTAAVSLRLLQEVHNQLCRFVKLAQTQVFDITTLASGTQEYALDDSILRIWAATCYTAPGFYQPLNETSYDTLDYESKSWRDWSASTPTRYYEVGSVVGLVPAPATASSGGYPFVRLYVTRQQTLTLTTPMPAQAPDYDAWIAGVCERWAFRNDNSGYANWRQIARLKREDLASYVMGRQVRNKPSASFDIPQVYSL